MLGWTGPARPGRFFRSADTDPIRGHGSDPRVRIRSEKVQGQPCISSDRKKSRGTCAHLPFRKSITDSEASGPIVSVFPDRINRSTSGHAIDDCSPGSEGGGALTMRRGMGRAPDRKARGGRVLTAMLDGERGTDRKAALLTSCTVPSIAGRAIHNVIAAWKAGVASCCTGSSSLGSWC